MKRTFLVTCATGDIGTELCHYLAKKGHDLILTGRCIEKLQELAQNIVTQYPDSAVRYSMADLGKIESMAEIIDQAKATGIDGIVLMPPRPPVLPADPLEQAPVLAKAIQDCVIGPRYLLQMLIPSMVDSSLKSVVVMSGSSSKQPILSPDLEAFNIVRTAWLGCLKSFADSHGPSGVRFNAVSPGQVITPTYERKLKSESSSSMTQYSDMIREKASSAPLKKLASIPGVVKTIYYLLKSTGANEITANNIVIDGGAVRPYC